VSRKALSIFGNGKRDRTPSPSRLRKIKRVSFKAFLYLKRLLKDFRRETPKPKKDSKFLSRRTPTINDPDAGIPVAQHKKNGNGLHYGYEPSRIQNTRDSSFWQWRRVAEWYRYINDPCENINGHT
jgi:hypothetical protein